MTPPKRKILIQLDCDRQASVFDAVTAIDAGVDHLLQYANVRREDVRNLVYGAIFTRGIEDLRSTAIFVGGSDVAAGEAVFAEVRETFFGPMRVSVMLDPNGANTTAAAAVLATSRHVSLAGATVLVLAATGPVGRRVVHLLAGEGAVVRAGSRVAERAEAVCRAVAHRFPAAKLSAHSTATPEATLAAAQGAQVVIAAGAPGALLMTAAIRRQCHELAVAVDLNAVPPAGLEGITPQDQAVQRDGAICYGAIGIGSTKMKIHKAAIRAMFESNDRVFDVDEIFALGRSL
jgi:hypothetical protein